MKESNYLISAIKALIYSSSFQDRHRVKLSDFSRNRKLPFARIFSMILKLVKKSLSIECELLGDKEDDLPPSKQAFSKARYKIRHTGFKELVDFSIKNFYEDKDYGTWRGYRVIAADGSSLRLPNSKEIVEEFGLFKPNGTSGKMPPIARVSLFVDLCTSLIVNARMARWDIGEQSLAAKQLPEVVETMKELRHDKLLFIYDRGYPSLAFMNQHQDLNVDFIFRLQRGMYKELWQKVDNGGKDFDFTIAGNKTSLKIRVVVINLPNGSLEVLATSLCSTFSIIDLGKAYMLRWQIEECYKRLKITTELENFSGTGLEAILQEFWAHLVICNILSSYMCDAQGPWNIDNLPEYRLNFSLLFSISRNKIFDMLWNNLSHESFQRFFDRAILRAKIKIRPGRLYSRDKVDKPKRHHVFRRVC